MQYNLDLEAPGIRTFQSELRMLSDGDTGQLLDQASWMPAHRMATMVTTGCDVIELFRPQHVRGVQTVIQEEVTSHVVPGYIPQSAAITDPQTGRRMSLQDAIRSGLFDMASGRFIDPQTGRRLSLSEAVQLGYVDAEFASQLQRGSGMRDPATGRELTVLEAMQKGYIDVSSGKVIDARTGEQLSGTDAAKRGLLSSDVANSLSQDAVIAKSTNVLHGYYGTSDFPSTQLPALPLQDVVNKNVYDVQSGKVIDPVTQRGMTLNEAVRSSVVSADQREVYDPMTGDVITVAEAVKRGIIDAQSGKYVDLESRKAMKLDEAVDKKLIQKPLALHTALTDGLMSASGQLHDSTDAAGSKQLTLLEAIERGILDTELKCILDTRTGELLSLSEAIKRGLINEEGQFIDPTTGSVMPLPAAINEGLAQVVQKDVSFADRPVIDSKTGNHLTLMEAIAAGIIEPATGMYVDTRSGRKMPLAEAERLGLVEHDITDKLLTPTGYRDASGKQLSVLELIKSGQFDPATGQLIDPQTGRAVSLEEAVSRNLIEPSDAALLLKTTSPIIATTTVTSEIQYGIPAERIMSVDDAVRAGLVQNNMFTDPTTGKKMSLNQAVHHGLLQVSAVDSDTEPFEEIPKKRAKSDIVADQSTSIARIGSVSVQRGVDEHQESEDTEEYTHKIADGTEHVRRRERREFHGHRTDDGGYESVLMQQRHVSSLASTRSVAGLSGRPDLPMSFSDAITIGYLNADTGYCQDPTTGTECTIHTALDSGLLDSETALFIAPESGRKSDMKTAIDAKLLEPTAHYSDRRSNERLSLRELIDKGIVVTQPKRDQGTFDLLQFTVISVVDPETELDIGREEAMRRGILDEDNGTYRNTRTGDVLSLQDAVDRRLVKVSKTPASGHAAARSQPETKSYTIVGAIDPISKTRVDVNTALQRGIIDQANGVYVGKDDAGNRFQIPISEAIKRGLVFTETSGTLAAREGSRFINTTKTFSVQSVVDPATGEEISVTEAIQRGIVDQTKGLYINPATGEAMPITEAVDSGFIVADVRKSTVTASKPADPASEILVSREVAYTLKSVVDPRTNRELSIAEATSLGILDCAANEFHHPVTGEVMSLDEAITRGLVCVERGRPSDKAGESREEKVPSLHIDDEADAREEMTSEELSEERRTFQIAGVVDPESGDVIPLNEAIENGLVDESGGMYIDPKTGQRMPISVALERGLIVGELVHKTEPKQLFRSTVVASRIDDIGTVFNPMTGTQIPVSQAIQMGLIGRDLMSYYNPETDETMSIDEAVRRGLAVTKSASSARKTATDGVMAVVDWDTGMIVERNTGRQLTPTEALRKGLIDEATARMIDNKHAAGSTSAPDEDVQMTIRTTEVIEQPPSAITIEETITSSTGRLSEKEFEGQLSFDAAVKLGLFSVKTGKFLNPLSGDIMSLSDAMNSRLINSKLPALVDLRTGRVCSLDEAVDRQLINVYTGRLDMSRISAANITLDPRSLPDVDWQLELNVEDAVACRLFDVESGRLLHPVTRRKLTLSDAVSGGVIAGDVTVVVNLETGARMSLTEALADGLINGQTGKMTLSADVAGDGKAAELTLLQAMNYGLIVSRCPPDNTSLMNKETGEKLPIDDAIQRGLARENASIVYSPRDRRRVPVKRAIQLGIVDRQSLYFCDPDTKRRVAPVDAARLGLLSVPGAPVLTDVARLALIQSAFETDVATEADARLKEKVTELAAAVLAPPTDSFPIAAVPQKGGDSKTVQSSTETQPMTVTVEDGVLRMARRTTTTVEKTETKESTLEPPKPLPQLTDTDTRGIAFPRPGLYKETPSKVSPTPPMDDSRSAVPKSSITPSPSRTTPATEVETVTTTSVRSVDGKTTPMDVDGRAGPGSGRVGATSPRRGRQLPQIPSSAKEFPVTTKQTVVSDVVDGRMIDTRTGETVPASEALRLGLVEIDWNTGKVKNTRTGEVLSADEAMRRGLIDSHIKNLIDNRLRHAGMKIPDVITLNDALTNGLLLVPLGRIQNPRTNQRMTVEEAVDIGFLDPDCSVIIDPASKRPITLTEAEKSGLMDFHSGDVKNSATGKTLTLTEMALQGYIPERGLSRADVVKGTSGGAVIDISRSTKTTTVKGDATEPRRHPGRTEDFSTVSLNDAVEDGLINTDTGYFRHPSTGEVMSLSEAVMRGYVSVPLREGDMEVVGIGFEDAIRQGLIDIRNNTFTEPLTEVLMPLDAAIRNGYVIIPESGIQLRITEEKEERLSETVDECRTVGEMRDDGIIQFTRTTETISSVDDAARGMCLMDAISSKMLDVETGVFIDRYTQQQMNFAEAVYGGFIEPRSAKVSICEQIGHFYFHTIILTTDWQLYHYADFSEAATSVN